MALHVSEERSELGRSLLERKAMTPDWVETFMAVPRAFFLPEVMWPFNMDSGTHVRVSWREDPKAWLRYADADLPIVTQWDDGDSEASGTVPTSSLSMPSVVFRMLSALDVKPGQRVLEIGTGTGWNAGLLANRLGLDNVTSIEIDPKVADAARDRLAAHGLLGLVLTRDGVLGDPAGAPYDRLIATAGLRQIPTAWIEQLRPGGVLVAPWGTHYSNADAVVRLTTDSQGASGHFVGPVEFMKLRSQRLPFDGHSAYVSNGTAGADRSTTDVTEAELLGESRFDPRTFAIGLRVRDCYRSMAAKRDGARPVWFYGLDDRSWACVMFRDGQNADVWQDGPRRLWDEVLEALGWWHAADQPGHERFGLTVAKDGSQQAWLDSPEAAWPV
ncbi:rRNA adenine N-6-methyltransferase family protein [Streptomyces sp. NPDC001817]|uniref:rRNA adenine N-6-methyltransferase family protein n=1 Tax=Streptomyces sp. NPDC001817 TaxID=3154398 RepID=UPI0033200F08